ncbi:MAG: cysteine desulfurase family protein [Suilimivivens sp.]
MVYLDNAATTAMSEAALNALTEVSSNMYGNPSSVYGFGRRTKKILDESRKIIANCIGAEPEEIYFTSCGTESDNWVLLKASEDKNKIITSVVEHHAVLYPAENQQKSGKEVVFLPVDSKCLVDTTELLAALDTCPVLVSIMLQNNEVGAIQNIEKIAEIVHGNNPDSLVHTDAVQAVGHIKIDVKRMGIDLLSASAHKFNGPKGIGFLYINKKCSIAPYVIGGGQENGMRSGTENVAGIYSMAKALEDNVANMESIHAHISNLDSILRNLLAEQNIEFKINGDSTSRAAGILNISIPGIDGEGLLNMLDMHDICISIGSACNSKSKDRSHVLLAMGLDEERIDSSVRISIGRFNTEDDIRTLVKWVSNCYKIAKLAEA